MFVRSLQLHDFRSWDDVTVDLGPGSTVFVGPNGHGKTNLLESLNYLSTLSSHRVSSDAPLIRAGASKAFVGSAVVNRGRELIIDVELLEGKANKARMNRSPMRRPREILGVLQSVLFAPEDLALVRGEPGERRRYLDELLVSRIPRMAGVRADYEKVLRQRSALLKTASGSLRRGSASSDGSTALATLDVWDGHLAMHGARLLCARIGLVHELMPFVRQAYGSIAPESRPASISYRCSLAEALPPEFSDADRLPEPDDGDVLEAAFLHQLSVMRQREIERGMCLVGPHRDDLELMLGDQPTKGFASHGESWSYALSLRLGSFALLREDGTDPVLMLDDVFAELDRTRRTALATVAAGAEQVLITAAVAEDVPPELDARRYAVEARQRPDSGAAGRISSLTEISTDTGASESEGGRR